MIKRIAVTLLLLAAFVGSLRPAQAQTADIAPERLIYGDTINRSFSEDSGDYQFTFYALKGDLLTISMVAKGSAAIDPSITLLDADNQVVARNDDSLDDKFGLTNARLTNFPVPKPGFYLLRAARGAQAKGDFTLTLRAKRSGNARANMDSPGSINGAITEGNPEVTYEFRANAGDVLAFDVRAVTSSKLTPSVVLLDPDNQPIKTSPAVTKATSTAALSRSLITKGGVYSIVVTGSKIGNTATTGDYKLTITREFKSALIDYGASVSDSLNMANREQRYIFQGAAGDGVTITMKSKTGRIDSALSLRAFDSNKTLIENDNGTGLSSGDALIKGFTLPADGYYVIVASRAARSTASGTFTLTLEK